MRTLRKILSVIIGVTLVGGLTSCSSTGGRSAENSGLETPRYVVAMITHGAPGDTFWDLVRKGAEDAAKKDNLELRYSNDPQAPNQANLVQSAIDSQVDGIALTMPNADALGPVAKRAADSGIPTVALNAGMDEYRDYDVTAFFGQEEKIAGEQAGKRLAEENAGHVLCVIHEQGNSSQESRCAGIKEGLGGGELDILYANGQDLTAAQATMQAKLAQDTSIDWIMGLQAPVAMRAIDAVTAAGTNTKIATFDTNAELVDAIRTQKIVWAVDQQPYLQGYLAIDSLWLAKRNGGVMGGNRPVYTGPSFIDAGNVSNIADAAQKGLR